MLSRSISAKIINITVVVSRVFLLPIEATDISVYQKGTFKLRKKAGGSQYLKSFVWVACHANPRLKQIFMIPG